MPVKSGSDGTTNILGRLDAATTANPYTVSVITELSGRSRLSRYAAISRSVEKVAAIRRSTALRGLVFAKREGCAE